MEEKPRVEFEKSLSGGGIGKFRSRDRELDVGREVGDSAIETIGKYGMVQKRARSVKEKKRLLEKRLKEFEDRMNSYKGL